MMKRIYVCAFHISYMPSYRQLNLLGLTFTPFRPNFSPQLHFTFTMRCPMAILFKRKYLGDLKQKSMRIAGQICAECLHFFYLHMAWPHFEIWLKNCPVMSVVDLISKAWVDQGTCFCKELEHLIWIHWSSRIISFMQLYNPQLFWRKLWPSCSKTICCLSTKVL